MPKKAITLIVALAAILFMASAAFVATRQEFSAVDKSISALPDLRPPADTDTDGDGLLDWEEVLWNTDPTNKDSDGDGTDDGAEIRANRNPAVKGPGDNIQETSAEEQNVETDTAPIDTLAPTDKLGRELFIQYLTLKQSGVVFDEENINKFITELVKSNTETMEYEVYAEQDIRIGASGDDVAKKRYGNELAGAISKNSAKTENELIIFSRFGETGNKEFLSGLNPIISSYKAIIRDTLALSVPLDAKEKHLNYLNALSIVESSLENMSEATNDPFIIYLAFERHLDAANILKESLADLKSYFTAAKIEFSTDEAGYRFTHGL
ncbi:MAG: hypothetical protein A3G52_00570 [Candidatus Taylorbacteria bacterium RIFCSPLOWO2_12_FULL_43_20]|uniref:Thrombospondin type 3 repeat superfamily protein n=1 Tax=Candidatus Taylorbacteria bacterium RIFCSPLOWO2_12_FULL_43_20 TaxID=1802332 RepID=A0A1G2P0R8_9BACT|nr:MAG: hypothetical protein A2825_00380 [Candidatus Taylorbacteria bacterium RIFCSPHIGHO2_01_FULL_43_120]OHA22741.1 MAG: hypothetical protein A3B98_01045 [Candidatus Taylorbacteria bacterium RIFCSPHIGHO2_02_FULL_43_55]OHA28651.1 MAG: hypothetical protein A3E92_01080 [Candidatus Taylorbacteria bacterium RIFCSPHIGHO2_12_FULL_42_34]OHA30658.1 MAG: hypothetical protein A3B09_00490 [Candidatus Taylorbacteria bacterium RIFCSPLOWO2_01_FULL_43_83]OHA38186.1 MAG: hypothetical protein A3H58_04425 [Candi